MASSYVERGGELSWLPPYEARGVNFFGFVIEADANALNVLCDRYLNQPLGQPGRFVPAAAHVMIVFNPIDRLQSTTKPEWGYTTEQETAVWLLVADTRALRLLWFHPYMWVDNDAAMVSGREVYGFPKALGWFDITRGPAAPNALSLETMVVRRYGKDSPRERATLLRAQLQQPGSSHITCDLSELFESVTRTVKLDFSLFMDAGLAAQLMSALLRRDVPMLFLKEFRSGEHPTQACFLRVQQVDARVTKLHDARIYFGHQFEVGVLDTDSHPIRRDLGLPAGAVPVALSFWVGFDLQIGDCTLIGGP